MKPKDSFLALKATLNPNANCVSLDPTLSGNGLGCKRCKEGAGKEGDAQPHDYLPDVQC